MKPQTKRLIAASIALVLFVLFLLAPRLPKSKTQEIAQKTVVDDEVQEAVDLVNGEQPMEGILKLRSILEKDPTNIDASWHLGLFSIQTGQYEKAIERLEEVARLDTEGKYKEVQVALGKSYASLGNVEEAKKCFNRFLESEDDPAITEQVNAMIEQLEHKR